MTPRLHGLNADSAPDHVAVGGRAVNTGDPRLELVQLSHHSLPAPADHLAVERAPTM
jgi:hypothetical protein